MVQDAGIIAIGPEAEIAGLRSVGVELVPVAGEEEGLVQLRQQGRRAEVRLVLLSESVAAGAEEIVTDLRSDSATVVVLMPSHDGTTRLSWDWMERAMERTIGVNILSKD